jgi:hypothetical protein
MQLRLILAPFLAWALALGAMGTLGACGSDDDNEETPGDKCTQDSQCGAAAPYCGPAGTCVACEENAHCTTAGAPVCETATNTCRGCSADSECSSGVCLATLGTCATADQLIHVKQGSVDTGMCEAASPCGTLNYAKNRISATRNVIRVQGNLSQAAELQAKIYVDGDGGTWTNPAAGPVLSVGTAAGDVTIEGLTLQGQSIASAEPVVQCLNNASLRVHQATIKLGVPGITAVCKVTVTSSKLTETLGSVDCTNNSVTVEDSEMNSEDQTAILGDKCAVKLARNKITGNPGPRPLVGLTDPPQLTIENNLLWDKVTIGSSGISVTNAPAGGLIRFNTIVNTSPGTHTGEAVICTGTSTVTSNVLAWQFGQALVGNACARRYNAFDSNTPVGDGEGNTVGTMAKLFVNPASDFHPGDESPALGLADPNEKIAVDLDGKARPASGRLDAGAYEKP